MTHYEVLGVASSASLEQIRLAYRANARELHPDTPGAPPDAQLRMSRCNEAWSVLSDPARRDQYDSEIGLAHDGDNGHDGDDEWVPPPGGAEDGPQSASIVQVLGPVAVLVGILMLAGGFLALAPAMLIGGVACITVGVYLMAATAVISLRSSGKRRR
jgi:DnaJ domain